MELLFLITYVRIASLGLTIAESNRKAQSALMKVVFEIVYAHFSLLPLLTV